MATNPESTAARDAPIAAFNLSANGVNKVSNCSLLCNARPPETMTLACPNSGRSLLVKLAETNCVKLVAGMVSIFSTFALPPSTALASNAVDLKVKTNVSSVVEIVSITLPA